MHPNVCMGWESIKILFPNTSSLMSMSTTSQSTILTNPFEECERVNGIMISKRTQTHTHCHN